MTTSQEHNDDIVQVGLVLVTHADYGSALLRAAESILGPAHDCVSVQVDANFEVGDTVTRLHEAVKRLESGRGVLILTDMFGGTPTNLSLALMKSEHAAVDVITGVNLPMLLRVLNNRVMPLEELSGLAHKAGLEGIIAAGSMLRPKPKES